VDNAYVRHYVTGGLELVALALDYLAHTHDGAFASRVLAPLARAVMAWFSEHYHRSVRRRRHRRPAAAATSRHRWGIGTLLNAGSQRLPLPLPGLLAKLVVVGGLGWGRGEKTGGGGRRCQES
jgi:hypothetical protein